MSVDQHGNEVAHKIRATSWVSVFIMLVGVVVGGVATVLPGIDGVSDTTVILVAAIAAVIFLVGGVMGLVTKVMDEVH